MPVGGADEKPALRAGINAYQLFSYAVQAGNGAVDLSDAIGAVAPGSSVLLAAMATGPMDRPRFSFGPAGETRIRKSVVTGKRVSVLVDPEGGRIRQQKNRINTHRKD